MIQKSRDLSNIYSFLWLLVLDKLSSDAAVCRRPVSHQTQTREYLHLPINWSIIGNNVDLPRELVSAINKI